MITEAHTAYPRAMAEILGENVIYEKRGCTTNLIEQDHRGIRLRYDPMLSFGCFIGAQMLCRAHEAIRQWLRPRQHMGKQISLAHRRTHIFNRSEELRSLFASVI